MEYSFEWDPHKARTNFRKHQISFTRATSVFKNPLAVSILDDEHDETEQRWVTVNGGVNLRINGEHSAW